MHYVYHPDQPPKVVETTEYNHLLENGWYDTPTKFPVKKGEGLAAKEDCSSEKEEMVVKKRGRPPKES